MATRQNQPALQVLVNGKWEYVFCSNSEKHTIVTTQNRKKALPFTTESAGHFRQHFANTEFRSDSEELHRMMSA